MSESIETIDLAAWVSKASPDKKNFRKAVHSILTAIGTSTALRTKMVMKGGMAQGSFPDYRSTSGKSLLEERRNAFVAVTRSKRLLFLTYPAMRMMPWGDQRRQHPSQFLREAGLT